MRAFLAAPQTLVLMKFDAEKFCIPLFPLFNLIGVQRTHVRIFLFCVAEFAVLSFHFLPVFFCALCFP
jgi:hypothetical protein